jgi:hypothetical protein
VQLRRHPVKAIPLKLFVDFSGKNHLVGLKGMAIMRPRFWDILQRELLVKKTYLLLFAGLLFFGTNVAKPAENEPANDEYVSKYEHIRLDFLRTHYLEVNNGRPIQITGYFSSYQWMPPFQYKERLQDIGLNPDRFNVLQFSLREIDPFFGMVHADSPDGKNTIGHSSIHYSFPLLLFQTQAGELQELDQLKQGDRLIIYGNFYNMKKSEYAIEVHLVETVKKGGHDREILIDSRVPPTPTPTATITPTPGPNLWQKLTNMVNPKETATPIVTTTPGPGQ